MPHETLSRETDTEARQALSQSAVLAGAWLIAWGVVCVASMGLGLLGGVFLAWLWH